MEKTVERLNDELIDLGTASVETKGPGIGGQDTGGLRNPSGGISED